MRRRWSFVLLVPAAVGLAFTHAFQQPTFKTGVQLVRIDVSVVDEKRQPVRGLQAADFTVLEDGQPRPVRAFRLIDHAAPTVTAGAAATPLASVPDVATNRTGDETSRLIVILMDRSIPPERPMLVARQIADAAVDAMAPGDLAAIVTTSGGVPQNFTSDRARLHKTIAATDWSQFLSQAQMDDPIIKLMDMNNPLEDGRCLCGLCVMNTITRIANNLRDVPRRKVLLFVGSNIIVQVGPQPGVMEHLSCGQWVRDSREALFDALGTSGLTVHAIDPQGLTSVGPAARATVVNGLEKRDGRVLNDQLTQERDDFMKAQGDLDVLPELTGGRTVLNANEPFRIVPDLLRESDAYYLLAFEPIEARGDVRHTIEVKVARKGVAVHSTRFIASTATAAAPLSPLDHALTNLVADASLPLGMAVATFAGPDRDHAYVGVTLDASAFAAAPGSIPLEIALVASDERGRRVGGARQTGTVQVPLGAGGDASRPVVELQTFLTLPPGEYELRGAVMNSDTRAAASVFTHITVPSFEDSSLWMSDVVLGTQEHAGPLSEGTPTMPIVPTTTRAFKASEPAWAFLRVYRATEKSTAQTVSVDTTVLDSSGAQVRHQTLRNATFDGRTADVRVGLPVKGLPGGRYVLRIDAKQGRADASRTVAFTIEATAPPMAQVHSPELDAALAAAAEYLEQYEQRISAVGAEEDYEQGVAAAGNTFDPRSPSIGRGAVMTAPTTSLTRRTRANIMTISLGSRGWVSFRDVFELDGHPVRDHVDRLSQILQNVNPESLEQARQIADESARYNLDPRGVRVDRTINVPMTALYFLRATNQTRSVFSLGRPERIAGVVCTTLQFTEESRPRLVRTSDDAPAQGTFWIDMANGGRIIKTELRMNSAIVAGQSVRAQSTVTYGQVDKLDLWLPVVMNETYELSATRQVVSGRATYSDFKEFKVTTSADIK